MNTTIASSVLGIALCFGSVALVVITAPPAHHYPAGSLSDSARLERSRNDRYSRHLGSIGELPLKPSRDSRVYRFLWLRSFHRPISVRVALDEGGARVVATEFDGPDGYGSSGRVLRRQETALTARQAEAFENALRAEGFWTVPPHDDQRDRNILDGAEWVIEAATTQYRVVTRRSPKNDPTRAMGERFLAVAGWTSEEVY